VVVGAGLLSQCGPNSAKGKETYGGVLPEIRAPESLDYSGLTYTAGYSAVNRNGVRVEYFPAGQGPKGWTQMLALYSIEKKTTPEQEVGVLAAVASTRGATPQATPGPGTDRGLHFTMPKGKNLEFNIFRYTQAGNGVNSLQYAAAIPQETARLGSGALRAVAEKHRAAIMSLRMPEVGRQSSAAP
jgi:hypothetical protein